jgi:hypothetical protein
MVTGPALEIGGSGSNPSLQERWLEGKQDNIFFIYLVGFISVVLDTDDGIG